MAYSDNNREWKLGHIVGQRIVIESLEVARGAAATDYHHAVEIVGLHRYRLESGYY